jgi:protein-S-isoprenylcysteine O-methyltransferase Ste14
VSREIPRWVVPVYWTAGFAAVHGALPWAISLLGARHGWVAGRPGAWNLLAALPLAAGLALVLWTLRLHFARTPRRVALEPTPRYLLVGGPYRWTRNPMYLAELVLWSGWALLYGSAAVVLGLAVLWTAMNFRVVPREERALEERFGEAFRRYRRTVPRWIGRSRREEA